MTNISRAILDSLLPGGSIWRPKEGDGLDLLLDGISENNEDVRNELSNLSELRNPLKTTNIDDLEKEYGISGDPSLTDEVRRQRLLSKKIGKNGNGTPEFIQNQLRKAGFDVYVYRNDPPVDPALLLNQSFPAWVGGSGSYVGSPSAYVGAYTDFSVELNNYEIPTNPAYWPLIFFIGGSATYTDGSLETIEQAQVDIKRRQELISLIVKYKPFHTWCGLIVSYT